MNENYKNLITRMKKKTCSTKNEKWRHACKAVEIAWRNEHKADFKVIVTLDGGNKNFNDQIEKTLLDKSWKTIQRNESKTEN